MSRQIQISAAEVSAICLTILSVMALTFTMMYLSSILIPLTLSIFIYLMVTPLIEKLENQYKLPTAVATISLLMVSILAVLLVAGLISVSVSGFVKTADKYQAQFEQTMIAVQTQVDQLGMSLDLPRFADNFQPQQAFEFLSNFTSGALGAVGNFVLVTLFLIFMMASRNSGIQLPPMALQVRDTISQYIWMKFFISAMTGVLVYICLLVIGLELSLVFAVLAFLLNFIPSIGSIVSTFLPLPIALIQFGVSVSAGLALILPLIVQLTIGNYIEPKMMGRSLDLHPITVMVFLLFWGIVWGVAGMFLAVPITSVIKIILSRFERTEYLADLMAGRFGHAG